MFCVPSVSGISRQCVSVWPPIAGRSEQRGQLRETCSWFMLLEIVEEALVIDNRRDLKRFLSPLSLTRRALENFAQYGV